MFPILVCFLLLLQTARGFLITVDAHETVCFFERAHAHDRITISFEVMDGGFMDIGVNITAPNDENLYLTEMETSGKYTFSAIKNGKYTLCFDNRRSTMTPKVLMFHFIVTKDLNFYKDPHKRGDDVIEQAVLQQEINDLASMMMSVKHEQEYMHGRYKGHLEISDSVHFRIVAWSIFGPTLLLVMAIVGIYYLKRFFEVKRVV